MIRHRWVLGLLAALWTCPGVMSPSGVQAQPSGGLADKYALLVSVRDYDKTQLKNLQYTENDVERLAQVLRGNGFRRVVTLSQTVGAQQARALPTAANVRRSLRGILEDRTAGDSVVIALAGHGVQFRGSDESYFCPMDARLDDRSTLIPLNEVYQEMQKCAAGVKLLLVDACRNDPQTAFARSQSPVPVESVTRPQKLQPPGGVAALFSCSAGQQAYESPELQHGVFFHYVVEGLRGKADVNRDGQVELDELVLFTKKRVADHVKEEFGDELRQLPVLRGEIAGRVTLTRVPSIDPRDARAIIARAIEAHGGADLIKKFKAFSWKGTATYVGPDGTSTAAIDAVTAPPNQWRILYDWGQAGKFLEVTNGELGWIKEMGKPTQAMKRQDVLSISESTYADWLRRLMPLTFDGFTLTPLGERREGGQSLLGVRVTNDKRPNVDLFFDKETGLLAKTELLTRNPNTGKEELWEAWYVDYRTINGLTINFNCQSRQGQWTSRLDCKELRVLEHVDPRTFAKP